MGRITRAAAALGCLLILCPLLTTAVPAEAAAAKISPEVEAQYGNKDIGRYIVRLADRADLTAARAVLNRDLRRRMVVDALHATADESQAGLRSLLDTGRRAGVVGSYRPFWVANAIAVESTEAVLRDIAARPEVAAVQPDGRRELIRSAPAQTRLAMQAASTTEWNIEKIGAPAAWDLGVDGSGAVVANIDTGVEHTHPAVAGAYRGADGNHDYDWYDAINLDPVPYDDNGHGTHTMGTMAGGDGRGPGDRDIGVAPGATWIAAKAFHQYGYGLDSWILDAAQFLTAPTKSDGTEPRPEMAPDVVNNSWGGGSCQDWFDEVLGTWRAMSIFPAFAIGNSGSGSGTAGSPGDSPLAHGVGATDDADVIAYFSSRGPSCYGEIKPEVSAPGLGVTSSVPGGGYASYSGTSMATPHVAGTVALMAQASGFGLSVDQIEQFLEATALDLGAAGKDNTYGAGRIQALEAVEEVLDGGAIEGTVTSTAGGPVAWAEVAVDLPSVGRVRTLSKPDGTYRLWLPDGAHQVHVAAFGYEDAATAATVASGQTAVLDVQLVPLPRAIVSGVVRSVPEGVPVADATVRVLDTPLDPVITGADGTYSVDVPVGTYAVRAEAGRCSNHTLSTADASSDVTLDLTLVRKLDGFGYVCDPVAFVHEPGTDRIPLTGDDNRRRIDLPFPFPFYGETHHEAFVHTNGFVAFADVTVPAYVNRALPSAAPPNAAIYGLWDDLWVRGSERGAYTAVYGTAPNRRFVIEFRNFEVILTGDLVNLAVVLGEDGTVEVRYRDLQGIGDGTSATIGLEDPTGTTAIQYSLDTPGIEDGSAIRFAPGAVGFVEGTVTNANDGLPVGGALLSIGENSVPTRDDGTYRIAAFPGSHDLSAGADGYDDVVRSGVSVTEGTTRTEDVALPAPTAATSPEEIRVETGPGGSTRRTLSLGNDGTGSLGFEVRERPGHAVTDLDAVIEDPSGDSAGSVDITRVEAESDEDSTRMRLVFEDGVDFWNIDGYIHLDTDQDPSTGYPPSQSDGSPGQDIGYDYVLSLGPLWHDDIYVYDKDFSYIGYVPADIQGTTVAFDVPAAMLGGDDGDMDVAMNAGTWYEGSTDWAPDAGHGTILAFVDLPWLSVTPTTGTVAAGDAQDLEVTFDASGLEPGTHRGAVFLRTSDPRRPTIEVDVTFVVHAFLRGVNAGGAAYVDTDGAEWSPDEQWLVLNEFGYLDPPTSVLTGGSSVVTTIEDIEGTDDDALFRSQRAGMGSYHVRVPRPGRYRVELGFAEIDGAAPGERVFNVVAESISPLLSSYDIVASAGGPMRADLHSFEIDLSDIWLDLHFEGITGDPVVNLLRVTSLD